MIFILINFLFNGFVLGFIYCIGYGFALSSYLENIDHLDRWLFGFGFFTSGLLTFIGITNIGQSALLLFISSRDPIGREKQKLEPLLNEVIANCNAKIGTKYSQKNIRIRISDNKEPNAYSLGRKNIILTEGLIRTSSDDELKAVLAHELGNLHYKYGVMLVATIFGSFATKICMWIYSIYAIITSMFSKIIPKSDNSTIFYFLMLIPLLMFLPIIILNWIGSRVLNLTLLFMGRKYGYKADKFAVNLGYQAGLVSFLEKCQTNNEYDNSFIGKIFAIKPPPMRRISKLEDN